MLLGEAAELCYNVTSSYLKIAAQANSIIAQTQQAITTTKNILINDTFPRWSPLNGEISFSYNGGKDCQVLLLLYLSCLWEYYIIKIGESQYDSQYHRFPLNKLPTVFIDHDDTFKTLEKFIMQTSQRYSLSLYESDRDKCETMAEAFETFLNVFPETQAIVIGIRHTDPFGEYLKPIQKTDSNWPDFYRLQPLLHWNLANIWSFLLYSNEPICELYHYGFTSLGNVEETFPNPDLEIKEGQPPRQHSFQWEIENKYKHNEKTKAELNMLDESDVLLLSKLKHKYYPGWYLIDDKSERAGRIKKPKQNGNGK
ncbi:Flavin adenine dinucleotide synthase [Nakaseomyces bracarensis]|uniref:FAD synthase n=1 Tax=Nakaseomyces bracarensis TaxID=273131 RepID=A0ABR4NWS0_9SACH